MKEHGAHDGVSETQRVRLVALLAEHHIGAAHGITGHELAAQLGIPGRRVRKLVEASRTSGVAICGLPSTGYYIAENAGDVESTCHFLRSRSMKTLMLEARLRKLTLPDLLGQLKLET